MSQPTAPRPGPLSTPRGGVTKHGSVAVTSGIRVHVSPGYLPRDSDPAGGNGRPRWVFAYRIRITNEGERRARLLTRHWVIVDADGDRHEVHGDGVLGHQPDLGPGEHFEYTSSCPLETPWGTMEGEFQFEDANGRRFPVEVARFYLVSPGDKPDDVGKAERSGKIEKPDRPDDRPEKRPEVGPENGPGPKPDKPV